MKNKFLHSLSLFITTLFFLGYAKNTIHDKDLYDILTEKYQEFPLEKTNKLLSNKKFRSNDPTHSIEFSLAVRIYQAAVRENDIKIKIQALERMYTTYAATDTHLAELILWTLSLLYIENENYIMALHACNQFKTLFPGSSHYWKARMNEIRAAHSLLKKPELDSQAAQALIRLCREYAADTYDISQENYKEVLRLLQVGYRNIILKEADIIEQYITRYSYSRDEFCILSALKRIDELSYLLHDASQYTYEETNIEPNSIVFIKKMEKLESEAKKIILESECIIPYGKEYDSMVDNALEIIKKNKTLISSSIKSFYSEIKKM